MIKPRNRFGALEFGSKDNEAIVLLHGFPANAASLKPVAKYLVSQGYYVVVPEQRGYDVGLRPKRRYSYRLSMLVEDLRAFLDEEHISTAHIVGHDWGGVVAWAFAAAYPNRTRTLTSISTPHPKALLRSIFTSKQLVYSWHMIFFQTPWLPEWILSNKNGRHLKHMLIKSGLDKSHADDYTKQMQDKHLLKGALNWYRALPFTVLQVAKVRKAKVPTLFIYGDGDKFLSKKAAQTTRAWAGEPYAFVFLRDVNHWIPEEMPDWLGERIVNFLKKLQA